MLTSDTDGSVLEVFLMLMMRKKETSVVFAIYFITCKFCLQAVYSLEIMLMMFVTSSKQRSKGVRGGPPQRQKFMGARSLGSIGSIQGAQPHLLDLEEQGEGKFV